MWILTWLRDPIPVPEKVRRPLTEIQEFNLLVDHRAIEMADFDDKVSLSSYVTRFRQSNGTSWFLNELVLPSLVPDQRERYDVQEIPRRDWSRKNGIITQYNKNLNKFTAKYICIQEKRMTINILPETFTGRGRESSETTKNDNGSSRQTSTKLQQPILTPEVSSDPNQELISSLLVLFFFFT